MWRSEEEISKILTKKIWKLPNLSLYLFNQSLKQNTMAIVKVIYLTSDKVDRWASILIDNIAIGQKAVQDITGNKILEFQLNDHSIYVKDTLFNKMVGTHTGKMVFQHICEMMYDNRPVIMNMNGGYIQQDVIDWEVIEIKSFEFKSWKKTNFLTLLRQENEILEGNGFTEIITE